MKAQKTKMNLQNGKRDMPLTITGPIRQEIYSK
jgi:hypothetical protein